LIRILLAGLIYLAPMAFTLWCILRLFRNRSQGFLYQWQRGLGWTALSVLPVVLAQPFYFAFGNGPVSLSGFFNGLALLPGAWMVLLGGETVIHLFEDNVKAWTGHRQDTMFDNLPVFFGMVLVQSLILSLLVTWRFRAGKSLRDPAVLAIGLFLLVNAALAIGWVWFGD